MQFANDARTKSYDQNLVQYIKMNNYADANWAASLPNRLQLKKEFEKNSTSGASLSISLAYTFDRAVRFKYSNLINLESKCTFCLE
jgi:hypothetical protein